MARIFIDGWEHGGVMELWDVQLDMSCVAPVTGMSGSYCLKNASSHAAYLKKILAASAAEL